MKNETKSSTSFEKLAFDLTDDTRIGPSLKVWWIPQIPGKPFNVLVNSFAEAYIILNVLAEYDLFQLANHIKPDYSNAGGLMEWDVESADWQDWETEDGGSVTDLSLGDCVLLDREFYDKSLREFCERDRTC